MGLDMPLDSSAEKTKSFLFFFQTPQTFVMLVISALGQPHARKSTALKRLKLKPVQRISRCGAKTPLPASGREPADSASPAPLLALKGAQSQPLGTFTDAGTRHHA
ncbi:hypothetical protein J4729_20405 [Leisingera sp. HS039]|uniref:hypothetical protein n=1 Tax=unclassified Leisingera TaxID=2614906 RepID=UPI001070E1F5|nr:MULTISPECIES: hypothetical protein [unclassified Leisingera]MBQ4826886.1 hypothetical protein [Leisingera sp. HS039]QBR36431.1 hypothetical protein ETW23_10010 [Leisingera sp. NJS201]